MASDRSSDARTLFSCLFANDLDGLLVGTKSEEDGMPHLGLTRPLGEFYLAHELRDKPRGRGLVLYFLIERLLVGTQRLHRPIERLQCRLVESGADMPSIDPAFLCLIPNRKYQRAKELARPPWFCVTDDRLPLAHARP